MLLFASIFTCLVVVAHAFPSNATIPFQYPLFKQCDPRWGKHLMVTKTICQVGCLMSSISMALNGHHLMIQQKVSDPDTLNSWLKVNGGYDKSNDLFESVVPKISPHKIQYKGKKIGLTPDHIKEYLKTKTTSPSKSILFSFLIFLVVIANVDNGGHFVLVVGYDAGQKNFYVNDPGFNRDHYTFDQIVGWRLFTML